MSLRKGSKVWVEDRDFAWVAAEVLDFVGKQVRLSTVTGKKVGIFLPDDFFSFFQNFEAIGNDVANCDFCCVNCRFWLFLKSYCRGMRMRTTMEGWTT